MGAGRVQTEDHPLSTPACFGFSPHGFRVPFHALTCANRCHMLRHMSGCPGTSPAGQPSPVPRRAPRHRGGDRGSPGRLHHGPPPSPAVTAGRAEPVAQARTRRGVAPRARGPQVGQGVRAAQRDRDSVIDGIGVGTAPVAGVPVPGEHLQPQLPPPRRRFPAHGRHCPSWVPREGVATQDHQPPPRPVRRVCLRTGTRATTPGKKRRKYIEAIGRGGG
jgi:hypothetical protein